MVVDLNQKLDSVHIELNGKFKALNTHDKELYIQFQQISKVVNKIKT